MSNDGTGRIVIEDVDEEVERLHAMMISRNLFPKEDEEPCRVHAAPRPTKKWESLVLGCLGTGTSQGPAACVAAEPQLTP